VVDTTIFTASFPLLTYNEAKLKVDEPSPCVAKLFLISKTGNVLALPLLLLLFIRMESPAVTDELNVAAPACK
jgi:hypothetical protein